MKTENTLENKLKFFALYYGQNVLKHKDWVNCVKNNPNREDWNHSGMLLQLKPLESISDEDAIKAASLLNWGSSIIRDRLSGNIRKGQNIEELKKGYIEIGKDAIQIFEKIKPRGILTTDIIQIVECVDYLRSKVYALSWMDLTVQDLIDYGWIKLKK